MVTKASYFHLAKEGIIRSDGLKGTGVVAVGELVEEINVGDHAGIKFASLFHQAPTQPY